MIQPESYAPRLRTHELLACVPTKPFRSREP